MPWGRKVGTVDFGAAAHGFVDKMQIAWFDRFLKGVNKGVDRASPVRLFDLQRPASLTTVSLRFWSGRAGRRPHASNCRSSIN